MRDQQYKLSRRWTDYFGHGLGRWKTAAECISTSVGQ